MKNDTQKRQNGIIKVERRTKTSGKTGKIKYKETPKGTRKKEEEMKEGETQ